MALINCSEIRAVDNWQEFYVQRFLEKKKENNNSKNRGPYVFPILYDLKECIGIMKQYWGPKALRIKLHRGYVEPTGECKVSVTLCENPPRPVKTCRVFFLSNLPRSSEQRKAIAIRASEHAVHAMETS